MKINIFNLIVGFIKNPKEAWANCKTLDYSPKDIFYNFLLPIILISACIKLVGRFLNLKDFSVINSSLTFFAFILISISVIFISSWIINKLLPKFKLEKNFNLVFKIISFASFPAIIANALSDLNPFLSFINFASIYSLVLFWIGSINLLKIPKEYTTGFILISLIIIATVLMILNFVTMSVFLSIFFNI
ncbi:MAG: YIP1 family protein [Bacteroidales bacterium]|nr:YIP1 family protein [Bacteroidales bacterium]